MYLARVYGLATEIQINVSPGWVILISGLSGLKLLTAEP